MPCIEVEEFAAIMRDAVPYVGQLAIQVLALEPGLVRLRMPVSDLLVRPGDAISGGTVTGPAQMALADIAMYGLVMSRIGRVELAVTTSLNVNFLRRPRLAPMIAEGRLLKLGKRLAVGEISLFTEGESEPAAHATVTYSLPPPTTAPT